MVGWKDEEKPQSRTKSKDATVACRAPLRWVGLEEGDDYWKSTFQKVQRQSHIQAFCTGYIGSMLGLVEEINEQGASW